VALLAQCRPSSRIRGWNDVWNALFRKGEARINAHRKSCSLERGASAIATHPRSRCADNKLFSDNLRTNKNEGGAPCCCADTHWTSPTGAALSGLTRFLNRRRLFTRKREDDRPPGRRRISWPQQGGGRRQTVYAETRAEAL